MSDRPPSAVLDPGCAFRVGGNLRRWRLLAEQSRYCAELLRHGLHGAIHPQHRGGERAYLVAHVGHFGALVQHSGGQEVDRASYEKLRRVTGTGPWPAGMTGCVSGLSLRVQGAQDADGIPGAVGVQGPTGDPGFGSVIQQWGTSTADAVGVNVTFLVPYASVPFVVATGEASTVYAKPTPTGVTITSPSGTQTVSWQALGC